MATGRIALTPRWAAATPNNCPDALLLVAYVGDKGRDARRQNDTREAVFRYETGTGLAPVERAGMSAWHLQNRTGAVHPFPVGSTLVHSRQI